MRQIKRLDQVMTTNNKRLIEVAFPLKRASLDSVHEKNVRHGPDFINEDPALR